MSVVLGVDIGGTYTDAVLIRDESLVIAKAKALTTDSDLAVGIGAAVSAVLSQAGVQAGEISMASLSTTLATNALVEGQGRRVGLVYLGIGDRDLETHGLFEALGGDPVLVLGGGHIHAGGAVAYLDLAVLQVWARAQEVSAVAVAAQLAARNLEHEVGRAGSCGRSDGAACHVLPRAFGAAGRPEAGAECAADRVDASVDRAGRGDIVRLWRARTDDGGARGWRADVCGAGAATAHRDDPEWHGGEPCGGAVADRGAGCAGCRYRWEHHRYRAVA